MKRAGLLLVFFLLFASREARAEAGTLIDLVTIGPGSYIFSYYGHSAVCVTDAAHQEGTCYDFGIPDTDDAGVLVWETLRGRARFVPIKVDLPVVVSTFEAQDRSIWKQRVPLSPSEAEALAASLEAAVREKKRYSYEPSHVNCTTEIRDLLDAALGGRLRSRPGPADSPRFRELMEEGFSGKPLELAAIALLVGWLGEAQPTAWEQMFLPLRLRDGVERLGAKPEIVHARGGFVLPTSTAAGRGMLVFLGIVAASAIFFVGRRSPRRLRVTLGVVGLVLGALALLVDAMAVVAVFPWVTRNLVLLVLLPTDLALPAITRGLQRYLVFRLALIGVALVLAAILGQPLLAVALFATLPLGAALLLERRFQKA